jgi:hypothetical protein
MTLNEEECPAPCPKRGDNQDLRAVPGAPLEADRLAPQDSGHELITDDR